MNFYSRKIIIHTNLYKSNQIDFFIIIYFSLSNIKVLKLYNVVKYWQYYFAPITMMFTYIAIRTAVTFTPLFRTNEGNGNINGSVNGLEMCCPSFPHYSSFITYFLSRFLCRFPRK
uniref:Uncharacterized protein n=1 Tax=Cacopsylla melanoneura TaxID=428564 RepID=A0A8D9FCJ5_9HEMI